MTAAPYLSGHCGPGRSLESHRRCAGQYVGTTCPCGHRAALRLADAPAADTGPRIGSLCSGYGGLDASVLEVLGGTVAWHADTDPAAGKVLDRHWPGVPNHGDITAADWSEIEPVDVLTAGYPCQPDSAAGKRLGEADDRWIWPAVRDAIRDLGPGLVVLENVRGHLGRGFPGVVGDLADIGYDTRWCCVPASAVGAPHRRERLFAIAWLADADGPRRTALPLGAAAAGWPERHDAGRGGVPPAADAQGVGRDERWPEPARQLRRPDDALGGTTTAHPHGQPLREQPVAIPRCRSTAFTGLAGATAADTGRAGLDPRITGGSSARGGGERLAGGSPGCVPDADPERGGRDGWQAVAEPAGRAGRGTAAAGTGGGSGRWGRWTPAIERWERLTRPAPDAVEYGARGNRRLNPAFSEWMMGLPAGWVTAVPGLSRNDQLRLIGNGVIPQQGAAALRWLLAESLGAAA